MAECIKLPERLRTIAPSVASDMPAPDVSLVLMRVFLEAHLATAHEKPARRARAFLSMAARSLADEESIATVMPIRPSSEHAAQAEARRQAIAWARQMMPVFLARLPKEDG
jgi:hypothetical protein